MKAGGEKLGKVICNSWCNWFALYVYIYYHLLFIIIHLLLSSIIYYYYLSFIIIIYYQEKAGDKFGKVICIREGIQKKIWLF